MSNKRKEQNTEQRKQSLRAKSSAEPTNGTQCCDRISEWRWASKHWIFSFLALGNCGLEAKVRGTPKFSPHNLNTRKKAHTPENSQKCGIHREIGEQCTPSPSDATAMAYRLLLAILAVLNKTTILNKLLSGRGLICLMSLRLILLSRGLLRRIRSSFSGPTLILSDLCQRSILAFDCG